MGRGEHQQATKRSLLFGPRRGPGPRPAAETAPTPHPGEIDRRGSKLKSPLLARQHLMGVFLPPEFEEAGRVMVITGQGATKWLGHITDDGAVLDEHGRLQGRVDARGYISSGNELIAMLKPDGSVLSPNGGEWGAVEPGATAAAAALVLLAVPYALER